MTPAQAVTYPWHRKLPRLGSEEEFAALRKLLEECQYSYDGICKRVKVDALSNYRSAPARELIGKLLEEPIDGLIRLFYDCVYVREDELARLLPGEGLRTLEALDLVARDPDTPGLVFATAAILLNAQEPDGLRPRKCAGRRQMHVAAGRGVSGDLREHARIRGPFALYAMRRDAGYRHRHRDRRDAGRALCGARLGHRYIGTVHAIRRIQPPPGRIGKHDGGGRRYVRSGGRADVRPHRDSSPVYSRQADRS